MPIKNIEFHSIFFINEFLAKPKTRGFIHCLVFIVQRVFSFTENPHYYIQSSIFFINGFSVLLRTRKIFRGTRLIDCAGRDKFQFPIQSHFYIFNKIIELRIFFEPHVRCVMGLSLHLINAQEI